METIDKYDHVIIYFSGGKDSLACILNLLEMDLDPGRVEVWHHPIDGREGSRLMDWPCTPAYCKAIAGGLGVPHFESWKVGGFEREMLRNNSLTAPTRFEIPGGRVMQIGGERGKPNTRLIFPQTCDDLDRRWCSAYCKIDVSAAALRNQKRFRHSSTLVISGERAEESTRRSRHAELEPDRADLRNGKVRRLIDRWRPVLHWPEKKIWELIEKYRINPHPAYRLGFGRCSCLH